MDFFDLGVEAGRRAGGRDGETAGGRGGDGGRGRREVGRAGRVRADVHCWWRGGGASWGVKRPSAMDDRGLDDSVMRKT